MGKDRAGPSVVPINVFLLIWSWLCPLVGTSVSVCLGLDFCLYHVVNCSWYCKCLSQILKHVGGRETPNIQLITQSVLEL